MSSTNCFCIRIDVKGMWRRETERRVSGSIFHILNYGPKNDNSNRPFCAEIVHTPAGEYNKLTGTNGKLTLHPQF